MARDCQLCTFHIDDWFLGVPVNCVQEILPLQEITPVPLAPPVVRGLINLRGEILTVLDWRRRIGLPECHEGQLAMNIVIRTDEGVVGLLVDELGDVLEVDQDTLEEPPETVDGVLGELIRGGYALDGHILWVLDEARTINFEHTTPTSL